MKHIHVQGRLLKDKPMLRAGVLELQIKNVAYQACQLLSFNTSIYYIKIMHESAKPFFDAFCG